LIVTNLTTEDRKLRGEEEKEHPVAVSSFLPLFSFHHDVSSFCPFVCLSPVLLRFLSLTPFFSLFIIQKQRMGHAQKQRKWFNKKKEER